ncbi:MAG: class I SAM-dependent methyltransferase [Acidobacteria bacterium]|nr:class I SAM-dependent methyltransferase [Acidobacteriota bacterium]
MARHVCPWWLGYWLVNPLRRLLENPREILQSFVREGMTVLEPGCGMGFFTLDLARLVGPSGLVVAVDLQERMLAGLRRRAARAGLLQRIDIRKAGPEGLCIGDLENRVDLACLLHMVHEVPDQAAFFAEISAALRPGGRLLIVEPKGHVSQPAFEDSLAMAAQQGLIAVDAPALRSGRAAVLIRAG